VSAQSRALAAIEAGEAHFCFETFFHQHYSRIARVMARVIRDPARAEDLAVEAFWKLWRNPGLHGDQSGAWLYRVAVRAALNELRRQARSKRYESLAEGPQSVPTPERAHAAAEEQRQVRAVLAAIDQRKAEVLLLRSNGLSYEELAASLKVNPNSVGSLLRQAQQTFRKEYIKRYGEPGYDASRSGERKKEH
jgi:RNA polymerase sigma-70 factor (ECF subfamily)